jgi:tellurite resistance protein TehA-like permease
MNLLQQKTKSLLPAYFAMVMATGIVSIALFLNEMQIFAFTLLYLNLIFLVGLLGMFVYRCFFFTKEVLEDFRSYLKGPGFFTIIAALCIVGNQFILLYRNIDVAKFLLIIAAVAWLIIGYGFFYNITVTKDKKNLNEGINGTWLVIIVAIQALSSLISFLTEGIGESAYVYLFLALCLFLLGCIFYLYIMSLIIYRISFFPLNAKELGAPYWINMGATAITTLAGSMLILHTEGFNFIIDLLPFIKGFTLFFWAAGTWWIPLLIILGMWRHLIMKVAVPTTRDGYDPSYWGMVFPLGMYTVATFRLSEALEIPFLKKIPEYFIYVAIFAWLSVSLGFIRHQFFVFFKMKIK